MPDWDEVDEASNESFPASDPPGWGSWHAAPSESTCHPEPPVPQPEPPPPSRPRSLGVWVVDEIRQLRARFAAWRASRET